VPQFPSGGLTDTKDLVPTRCLLKLGVESTLIRRNFREFVFYAVEGIKSLLHTNKDRGVDPGLDLYSASRL
jgi:hypothetical protein